MLATAFVLSTPAAHPRQHPPHNAHRQTVSLQQAVLPAARHPDLAWRVPHADSAYAVQGPRQAAADLPHRQAERRPWQLPQQEPRQVVSRIFTTIISTRTVATMHRFPLCRHNNSCKVQTVSQIGPAITRLQRMDLAPSARDPRRHRMHRAAWVARFAARPRDAAIAHREARTMRRKRRAM